MEDIIIPLAVIGGLVAIVFASIFGLCIANEAWNCREYTDAKTKMIAGTCYVQEKGGKWVTFSSYTKALNVNVQEGAQQ